MRFKCYPTEEEDKKYIEYKTDWHPHFCWLPKKLPNGECAWLETVYKKWVNPYSYHTAPTVDRILLYYTSYEWISKEEYLEIKEIE